MRPPTILSPWLRDAIGAAMLKVSGRRKEFHPLSWLVAALGDVSLRGEAGQFASVVEPSGLSMTPWALLALFQHRLAALRPHEASAIPS